MSRIEITDRDVRIVKDIALSHVQSSSQTLALYFSSVTRTNTRLRELRELGLLRKLDTPFFSQSLHMAGPEAQEIVGDRISPLLAARTPSPRFLQHALTVTNARLNLFKRGAREWKFEPQLRTKFRYMGKEFEVRPDGLAVHAASVAVVEVDLGHVAPTKFLAKLQAFDAFIGSGACKAAWGVSTFTVLTLTTGPRRQGRLKALLPSGCRFAYKVSTLDEFGVQAPGNWS